MKKKPAKKAITKAARKAKRSTEPDINQLAQDLVQRSTKEEGPIEVQRQASADAIIKQYMAELGRRGGKIGGAHRAASMSPERRREIASMAARKRWGTAS